MKRTTTDLHPVCSETLDVEEDDVFFPLAIRILFLIC
jgi:hypothetical protein